MDLFEFKNADSTHTNENKTWPFKITLDPMEPILKMQTPQRRTFSAGKFKPQPSLLCFDLPTLQYLFNSKNLNKSLKPCCIKK